MHLLPPGYKIEPVFTEFEVNYKVYDTTGYLFRLVPGETGFVLSKLDECFGIAHDDHLITSINHFILQHEL